MKLQDLNENQSNSVLVVRGIADAPAEAAKSGKPIPVPERGMSWWAYDKKPNPTVEDIVQEFEMRRTYGAGGVLIKTTVPYTINDGWLHFAPTWGFGVEHEDSIPDEIYEILKERGMEQIGVEFFLPAIPLKKGGTSFVDYAVPVWNGLVCKAPTVRYELV